MLKQTAKEKLNYISFDVFDTLIKRSIAQPSDLFRLMEGIDAGKTGGTIPAGFAEKRIHAGMAANEKLGKPAEIRKIYELLSNVYGEKAYEWMDVELKLELDGCQPNAHYVDLFSRYVSEGKQVILISDMYLSSEFISRMLSKCGVFGYRKLYVSCEYGACKRDGTLFQVVLKDLKIRPSQLRHIGDARKPDILLPASMGIRVGWPVKRDQKELCRIPKGIMPKSELTYRTLRAAAKRCSAGMSEYEKMGCWIFGPMLLGMVVWLAKRLREDGIQDVYFMSRDGYIMKQAFELLGIPGIRTNYLYCSRRSYTVPMLYKNSEFEDTIQYIKHIDRLTLRSYLERIGLEPDKYKARIEEQGLDIDYCYEHGLFFKSEEIRSFYYSIRQDVISNAKSEYDDFLAYIRSMNMRGEIAVVDIGYWGTMQHALMRLIEEAGLSIKVRGYYLAVNLQKEKRNENDIDMAGYLFDDEENAKYNEVYGSILPLVETQFIFSKHGSVKRFTQVNGTPKPVCYPSEYIDSSNGKDAISFLAAYQSGALAFIRYVAKSLPVDSLAISPDIALEQLIRLGTKPTLREARQWGDIKFHDMGGVIYCARAQKISVYLRSPGQLRTDFMRCLWKIGFMKRILLIPCPYDKIYRLLKHVYKNER